MGRDHGSVDHERDLVAHVLAREALERLDVFRGQLEVQAHTIRPLDELRRTLENQGHVWRLSYNQGPGRPGLAQKTGVMHQGALTVKGRVAKPAAENQAYLHRGIAGRAFERRFQLADYIEATGADLQLGVLSIELERRLPEALKPRTVAIGTAPRLESKAA